MSSLSPTIIIIITLGKLSYEIDVSYYLLCCWCCSWTLLLLASLVSGSGILLDSLTLALIARISLSAFSGNS